jgi:heterogeneous nuclear ribonucleoprotein A1/A3
VEIKKAEPKKSTNPPPSVISDSRSVYGRGSRDRPSRDNIGAGLPGVYSSYDSGFGPYRNHPSFASNLGNEGVGDYHGRYGRYYPGIGSYEGMSSYGYPSRYATYGGGFDGPYAGGNLSAYRRGGDESFGGPGSSSYSGAMYAGAYDPALGAYGAGGPPDMNRGSFGTGRYHPYG